MGLTDKIQSKFGNKEDIDNYDKQGGKAIGSDTFSGGMKQHHKDGDFKKENMVKQADEMDKKAGKYMGKENMSGTDTGIGTRLAGGKTQNKTSSDNKDALGKDEGFNGKDSTGKDSYGKDPYGSSGKASGKDSYGDSYGKDSYGRDSKSDSYGTHGKSGYGAAGATGAGVAGVGAGAAGYSAKNSGNSSDAYNSSQSKKATADSYNSANKIPTSTGKDDSEYKNSRKPSGKMGGAGTAEALGTGGHKSLSKQDTSSSSSSSSSDDAGGTHDDSGYTYSGVQGSHGKQGFSTGNHELDKKIASLSPEVQQQAKEAFEKGYRDAKSAFKT